MNQLRGCQTFSEQRQQKVCEALHARWFLSQILNSAFVVQKQPQMISDERTWLCSNQPELQNRHWTGFDLQSSFAETWPRCLLLFVINEESEAQRKQRDVPKATQVVSGRTRLITSCAYSFVSFHPLCSFCSIKETPKHNLSSPRALETRKLLSTFLF